MIYCIWYPSGGFGHFLNAIISLHGKGFKRPTGNLTFSNNGNSHQLDLVVPKYHHDPSNYTFEFDLTLNYSVLIDNGINNEGKQFLSEFSNPQVIKVCYSNYSWPVVSLTLINKAMKSSIEENFDTKEWNNTQSWCRREKYFLYLKDHTLRQAWKSDTTTHNIFVEDLLDYDLLKSKIENTGITLNNFKDDWTQWHKANARYFNHTVIAEQVIDNIKKNQNFNLEHISDEWTQAVIYYYIWLEFEQEVPHSDYADFFKDTSQIKKCLKI
jgi:hypothetical protein